MQLTGVVLLCALSLAACGDLKYATDSKDDDGDAGGDPAERTDDASTPSSEDVSDAGGQSDGGAPLGPVVTMSSLARGRSRVGARSTTGFTAWRSGIVATSSHVYWVESGTAPGLYRVPTGACASGDCVEKIATLTRPSAFARTSAFAYVADTTVLKRWPLTGGGAPETLASASEEINHLAAAPTDSVAFWTTEEGAIRRTAIGGMTSTPIYSNGTPIAFAIAGDKAFWAGVDISGLLGAIQSIGTNGSGAREVKRFNGNFDTIGGNATFLYYAVGSPRAIHRMTLASGRDEVLANGTSFATLTDFAVDEEYAYFTDAGDAPDFLNGRVFRIAHDDTKPETLAVSIARPLAIAVHAGTAYVASAGTKAATYADGSIVRLVIAK